MYIIWRWGACHKKNQKTGYSIIKLGEKKSRGLLYKETKARKWLNIKKIYFL